MRLVSYKRGGEAGFGAMRDADTIVPLRPALGVQIATLRDFVANGDLAAARRLVDSARDTVRLADVTLLPPIVDPSKILCSGLNYEDHRIEGGREQTQKPTIFLRVAESQIGHLAPIVRPAVSTMLDYEGEIAVVIGKGGRGIAVTNALDHVFGYSCYNDASVRDWQRHTTQWSPGKNFDSTGAFGPWLVTADELVDAQPLELTTRLNGEVMQHAFSDQMTWSIADLIAYISAFTTLRPGDVIVTGTPGGVGAARKPPIFMKAGDVVEIEVSGVGVLRNPVVAGE
jgi:2-keto-4-pentenoate hydratase/2-oxohepta-3-ene-1,7-dioic acid hydratase in catechol pathway